MGVGLVLGWEWCEEVGVGRLLDLFVHLPHVATSNKSPFSVFFSMNLAVLSGWEMITIYQVKVCFLHVYIYSFIVQQVNTQGSQTPPVNLLRIYSLRFFCCFFKITYFFCSSVFF